MKTKVKSTGEVIEVEKNVDAIYHVVGTNGIDEKFYYDTELDFNIDEQVTVPCWVGRDEDDQLYLYFNKPQRSSFLNRGIWDDNNFAKELPTDSFPDITWKDDAIETEVIIRRKK